MKQCYSGLILEEELCMLWIFKVEDEDVDFFLFNCLLSDC